MRTNGHISKETCLSISAISGHFSGEYSKQSKIVGIYATSSNTNISYVQFKVTEEEDTYASWFDLAVEPQDYVVKLF